MLKMTVWQQIKDFFNKIYDMMVLGLLGCVLILIPRMSNKKIIFDKASEYMSSEVFKGSGDKKLGSFLEGLSKKIHGVIIEQEIMVEYEPLDEDTSVDLSADLLEELLKEKAD